MHSVPEFPDKVSEFAKDFICQCLRKHPGDRPTVMEMLHHPWIRTFQRRTSMRITAAPRRRSSITYNPHAGASGAPVAMLPLQPGPLMMQHAPYTPAPPPQEAADEGAVPMDTEAPVNYNEMTPEQIEGMIRKLQVWPAHCAAWLRAQLARCGVAAHCPLVVQAVHSKQHGGVGNGLWHSTVNCLACFGRVHNTNAASVGAAQFACQPLLGA